MLANRMKRQKVILPHFNHRLDARRAYTPTREPPDAEGLSLDCGKSFCVVTARPATGQTKEQLFMSIRDTVRLFPKTHCFSYGNRKDENAHA